MLIAHAGQPLASHDLWTAWNLDPVLLLGLTLAVVAYRRGRAPSGRGGVAAWRQRCFIAGVGTLVVALVSPLEALSGSLASAHMVQHVLLLLVAAPLFAFSAPASALLRGSPLGVRRATGRWRRRLGLERRTVLAWRHPVVVWLAHVLVVWLWHAAALYDAAVGNEILHVAEHAAFLLTGLLFWQVVIGARTGAERVSNGLGVLLVFGMAMQSVFLSALLTFSPTAWYDAYVATTAAWGLDALADQQLAGVIMWIPAGFVYLGVALSLMVTWITGSERDAATPGVTIPGS